MSVDVTLLPAAIPHRLRDQDVDRTRAFEDRDDVTYGYSVPDGGALVIWRTDDQGTEIEAMMSAAAWQEVQGDLYKSMA